MKLVSPMQWLERVIYYVTGQAPMVRYEQTTSSRGRFIVSLSINIAGMREQTLGDTVIIHVNSFAVILSHVAASDAVRKALIEIEVQTRHVFPDYSYFKIKALEHNNMAVTEMPKRISPSYTSSIVCN